MKDIKRENDAGFCFGLMLKKHLFVSFLYFSLEIDPPFTCTCQSWADFCHFDTSWQLNFCQPPSDNSKKRNPHYFGAKLNIEILKYDINMARDMDGNFY